MRLSSFFFVFVVIIAFVGALASEALAVASGKKIEYADGSEGKVIFDGKVHADKGLKCSDCHPKIWPMKKGSELKMADINAGKYCGTCHNGEKAFKTNDQANCKKCHKK